MRRKVWLWITFLLILLLISVSATPYSKTADVAFISVRFSIIIVVSILALREWWRTRHNAGGHAGAAGTVLRRLRGWYYDDKH
jgi:hypothetical protein